MTDRVTVGVITRDRRDELLRTLGKIENYPERPRLTVVANASRDGSAAAVRGTGRYTS